VLYCGDGFINGYVEKCSMELSIDGELNERVKEHVISGLIWSHTANYGDLLENGIDGLTIYEDREREEYVYQLVAKSPNYSIVTPLSGVIREAMFSLKGGPEYRVNPEYYGNGMSDYYDMSYTLRRRDEYLVWLEFEVRSKEYTDDEELYDLAVKYFYSFKQPLIWTPISSLL
jgi:hypothetical protein